MLRGSDGPYEALSGRCNGLDLPESDEQRDRILARIRVGHTRSRSPLQAKITRFSCAVLRSLDGGCACVRVGVSIIGLTPS